MYVCMYVLYVRMCVSVYVCVYSSLPVLMHVCMCIVSSSDQLAAPKYSAQGRRTQSTSEALQHSVTVPMDSEGLPSGDSNAEGIEFTTERRRSRDVDELDQRRQKVRRSSFTRRSSHNFDQDRRRSKDGGRPPSVQRSRSVERSMDVEHSPSPIPQITSPSGKSPTTPDSAICAATLDIADRPMRHQPLKNKSSSSSDLGPLVDKDKQFHTLPSMRRRRMAKDMEVSAG